ncbi:hypothetical protein [Streptomyces cinerochromogenes]|uniref:hypothetical protein n=1 Tax=Streptomyces cinerochromogenes TaxID=66422 RepID=UPI00167133A0|nr:hypothetical protein [Streptomyces cinerochromogenes]GGS97759.1 hypothetical protein GCM10010206_70670 [Streptomyces cinerochromogenes]
MSAERRTPRRGAPPEAADQLRMRRAVVLSTATEPAAGSDTGESPRTAPAPVPPARQLRDGAPTAGLRTVGARRREEAPEPEGGTADGAAPAGGKPSQRPMLAAAAVAGAVLVALPLALSHNDKDGETDFEASGRQSPSPRTVGPDFTIDVPTHPTPATSSRSAPAPSASSPSAPSRSTPSSASPEPHTSSSPPAPAPSIRVSPRKPYQGPGIRAPHPETPPTPRATQHAPTALAGGAPQRQQSQSHPASGTGEHRTTATTRTAATRTTTTGTATTRTATTGGPTTSRSTPHTTTPHTPRTTPTPAAATRATTSAAPAPPAPTPAPAAAPAPTPQTATPTAAPTTAGGLVVEATRVLEPGTSIVSDRATLAMRDDGNLVVTDENGTVRWSSHTEGRGYRTVFQADGHLVVYTRDDQTAWSSGTAGHDGAQLVLQDDGDVVIQQDGTTLWVSGTAH